MIFNLLHKSTSERTITNSRELSDFIQGGVNSLSGVSVTPATASKFAPVFACIKVLSEGVGQLPLNLFERTGEDTKRKARSHPLFRILHDEPNDYQTAQEFWEMCVAHVALAGNFYGYVNESTATGKILEILPLQPAAVEPVQDEDYTIRYKVTFPNSDQDVLDSSQVLHIKGLSFDGITGVSNITHARNSIGLGMATETHGSKLFSNGANPGGILSTDSQLKKEQIELLRGEWDKIHGGAPNSHKTAILQGGLKWAQVGLSSDDAQFLETRKFQRSEIAGIFRVPLHMIGDLERATFTNIEHQGLEFVVYSLMPYIRRIEQRISKQLLKSKDKERYYPKFNVNGLLRGDMKTRGQFYRSMFNMGALSPNEIRKLEDFNPRDGGDEYFVPLNMVDNKEGIEDAEEKPV